MKPEYTEKKIVQTIIAAAAAVSHGTTISDFCEEKGITTEEYFGWVNRYGEVNLNHINVESLRPLWASELWSEYREVFKTFVGETLLTVVVILILIGFDHLLDGIGYPKEKREMLDAIHYIFSMAILIMFACSSIIKLLILVVRGIVKLLKTKKSEK
jgi:hypothetical protein